MMELCDKQRPCPAGRMIQKRNRLNEACPAPGRDSLLSKQKRTMETFPLHAPPSSQPMHLCPQEQAGWSLSGDPGQVPQCYKSLFPTANWKQFLDEPSLSATTWTHQRHHCCSCYFAWSVNHPNYCLNCSRPFLVTHFTFIDVVTKFLQTFLAIIPFFFHPRET